MSHLVVYADAVNSFNVANVFLGSRVYHIPLASRSKVSHCNESHRHELA